MKARITVLLLLAALSPALGAQNFGIDAENSKVTVRVFKSGLFSAFAHDHEISAPIVRGTVLQSPQPSVELVFDARRLRVLDPGLAPDKRAEVQKTMLGPQVLDSERFPEITFRSSSVQRLGGGWRVQGEMTIHGQTRPVTVEVAEAGSRYRGSVALRQRQFGIQPVSIAGGTVKVKDEIKIEFDVALRH
jgi:YceI-like domain